MLNPLARLASFDLGMSDLREYSSGSRKKDSKQILPGFPIILRAAVRSFGESGVKILAQSVETHPGIIDAMLLAMKRPDN
jgi:hypothetical protein